MANDNQGSQIQEPPTSFLQRLRFVGPSLIITATLVGSGELLTTTTLGAKVGFRCMWLIVGACLVKVALQEALGRYTISSGETTLRAVGRLPGPKNWGILFWLAVIMVSSIQLGAVSRVVGESIKLMFGQEGSQEFVWAPIVCFVCLAILINGKYQTIERFSTLLVSLFSITTIVCAVAIQFTPAAVNWQEFAGGFRFQLPAEATMLAVSIIAIVGLSSSELVYYGYWCLEKGYARWTGENDGTTAWAERAKGWIRVMHVDCILGFLIYTTTTVAFYLLGAAVLHRQGIDPGEGMAVLQPLSKMYTDTLGVWAFFVFIGSAFLVLFSTLFVTIASYSRLVPDACFLVAGRVMTEADRVRWNRISVIVFAVLFAALSQVRRNPVQLVVIGTYGVAMLLPVIALAAVYLRYRHLDPQLRPSLSLDICLWASALLTAPVTCYSLWKAFAGS